MMKIWKHGAPTLALAVGMMACSGGNNGSSTNNGAVDSGPDLATVTDMGSPEDTGNQPEPDSGTDPIDLGTDAAVADTGADMADLGDEPDLPPQNCFHPSADPNCPMGEFGAGAFMDTVRIVEDRTCCRDFDGDGNLDNKIGEYMNVLKNNGTDMNARVEAAIQAGQLAYLLEFANWSNEVSDPTLDVRLFLGTDVDFDYTDNLAGTGFFLAEEDSFKPNGDAKWTFETATVRNGRLHATGGTLELAFPGLLDEVRVVVTNVVVDADVIPPADLQAAGRVTLDNGELSGALNRDMLFTSMNEASAACACLQKQVFAYSQADDKWLCEITEADALNCQFDTPGCQSLADRTFCSFFQIASDAVDVDADGDGKNDSFSVGTQFTAVGASITGRTTP